jgi:tRNA-(ms[2]io[6]A)-hydroxylase
MNSGEFEIGAVLSFLRCRSPQEWVVGAIAELDILLLDHASLELKAAQQAQKLIWKYGAVQRRDQQRLDDDLRRQLNHRMSRLAREELRHFEQVSELLERRGVSFVAVSPSRYAAGLHALARRGEPDALIDALLIGAIIEARSCERFFSLIEPLRTVDPELASFYASLLKSEARHFEDYLRLARAVAADRIEDRLDRLLERDAELITSADTELRFHSGPPAEAIPLK